MSTAAEAGNLERIGFIGLGAMGVGMAANIARGRLPTDRTGPSTPRPRGASARTGCCRGVVSS